MLKGNNRNTRTRCEICSKLTLVWTYFTPFSSGSTVNFEHINASWVHATTLFLYPLKTSENQRFPDVFRGYRKWLVACSGLKVNVLDKILKLILLLRFHIWYPKYTKYFKIFQKYHWNVFKVALTSIKFKSNFKVFTKPTRSLYIFLEGNVLAISCQVSHLF